MNTRKSLFIALCLACWILTSAFAGNLILKVDPPNGTDDTVVIQAALDQCVALGPGCTVQLDAGTYLTRQLMAKNYDGNFKGKGMDLTVIQSLPGLACRTDNKPVFNDEPTSSAKGNPYPMLVLFFGGNVTVSDMTIKATAINPVPSGWFWYEPDGGPFTFLWSVLEFMGNSAMNVAVDRVAIEGIHNKDAPFDYYNATAAVAMDAYPPVWTPNPGKLPITFRISASRMMNASQGIWAGLLDQGRVTIGGSPNQRNLIKDCEIGAWLADPHGCSVDISYNDIDVLLPGPGALYALGGVSIVQGSSVETPTIFMIQHNRISASGSYGAGIWITDEGVLNNVGKKADVLIFNNTITVDSAGSPALAGIEATLLDGAEILNNSIVGNSSWGISLEGAANCLVRGNNLQNLDAYRAPIGLLTYLGHPTHDCTIVPPPNRAAPNKYYVYSDPQAYNNTIVGVNNRKP